MIESPPIETYLSDLLDDVLMLGRTKEPIRLGGLLAHDTATVLSAVLVSGQEFPLRLLVSDMPRLAQVVSVTLDLLSADLDRQWRITASTFPLKGCEKPMTMGAILRLLQVNLPIVATTPDVYEDVKRVIKDQRFCTRDWQSAVTKSPS